MILRVGQVSLLLLVGVCLCEEWFMPESHLISDQEFREKVLKDRTTYKLVKYFTPNCVYCRYLKMTVDKLKKEKQWSFPIYDLNCAWYPKFCNQEIHASAFPFTAVYNEKGEEDYQMVGYYPENVVLEIFQKVQEANLELNKHLPTTPSNHQSTPQKSTPEQEATQSNNLKNEEPEKKLEKEEARKGGPGEAAGVRPAQQDAPLHLNGAYQHIFFAICILLGVVYFSSFLPLIKTHPKNKHNPESPTHSHSEKLNSPNHQTN